MECPYCGASSGALTVVVGIVKIISGTCSACGRHWKKNDLTVPFVIEDVVTEVERLEKRYVSLQHEGAKIALAFLRSKIYTFELSKMDKASSLRKRRNDLWEKKFLKDALGDDYWG